MEKIKQGLLLLRKLFIKYKELILYVFFGALTTLCNLAVFSACRYLINIDELTSTVIAFIISVVFAFYTNRKWVFFSRVKGAKAIFFEGCRFFSARIFSGVLDVLIMFLFVTVMGLNDMLIKLLSNILVVILNFIFSKLFVFKKKQ